MTHFTEFSLPTYLNHNILLLNIIDILLYFVKIN